MLLTVILAAGFVSDSAPAAVSISRATAPRFTAKDVTGRTVDLDTLLARGPVLLDFWATWCKPCVEAMPDLQRLHATYGERGLTVIGISVDGPRNHAKVRPFATRLRISYPIVIDHDERLRHLYQVVAMPTVVLIEPGGRISSVRLGYRPGEGSSLELDVAMLIAKSGIPDSSASPFDGEIIDSPLDRDRR